MHRAVQNQQFWLLQNLLNWIYIIIVVHVPEDGAADDVHGSQQLILIC